MLEKIYIFEKAKDLQAAKSLTNPGLSAIINANRFEIGCEKEEYMHNPARENIPSAERIFEEVWMEGSF